MNERSCNLRFAVCDCVELPNGSSRFLSLTPRFSRVYEPLETQNRFSGFKWVEQTAEAVQLFDRRTGTPLKRGVNETEHSDSSFQPQIANRKSGIP